MIIEKRNSDFRSFSNRFTAQSLKYLNYEKNEARIADDDAWVCA